jgi:hypothetical protein
LATSAATGDLILAANGRDGFYFSAPMTGMHGGLYRGESETMLVFALPTGLPEDISWLRETVSGVIGDRCAGEGNRQPSVADMVPTVLALLGLAGSSA